MGKIMKKAKKRAKSKTSSKRRVKSKTSSKHVGAKSKTRKQIKAKPPTKSSAGLAAVGTALSAMKPQQKGAEEAAGSGAEKKVDTSKN
jgi:hypothetical protein